MVYPGRGKCFGATFTKAEPKRSLGHWAKIALLPLILVASAASYFIALRGGFLDYQTLAANHD